MDLVDRYLLLGLRLGRHVDGFVDFYYGPPEHAATVTGEEPSEPAALASEAERLLEALAGDGAAPWLLDQVRGLRAYAGVLAGEPVGYSDEVERCYGVRPVHTPEQSFIAAHSRLEALLPAGGALGDRYESWRQSQVVPPELLGEALARLLPLLRARTAAIVELPAGEAVEVELVSGEPWLAFNYYLGGLRSRIAVNTALPFSAVEVLDLVAHEAYPGHHTEHACKEASLVRARGRLEESAAFLSTPQALVSEGIAMLGCELALDSETMAAAARIFAGLGVRFDPAAAKAVTEAYEPLALVAGNVALMIHEDGATREEAVAYIRRWRLVSEARASHSVDFVTDPTWRAYVTTYAQGLRLCRAYAGADPRVFARLLTEQVPVADLAAAGA